MSSALAELLSEFHIDGDRVARQVRSTLAAAGVPSSLTPAQRAVLTGGGLDMAAVVNPERELGRGLAAAVEVREGYSTAQVAANNSVQPGRVRSWLSADELVAVKVDGRSRFPRFQFDGAGRRIPGLATVTPHKPGEWSWRVWRNFLTTPQPAFASPDGEELSALEWLASGGDPDTVIAMTRVGW